MSHSRYVYSLYEAKARFSELLRRVREGSAVVVTYRGRPVAEVRPVPADAGETLEARLARLEGQGLVRPPRAPGRPLARVARRPGALRRFLAARD